MTADQVALIDAVFLLAGTAKGPVGLGLPAIIMGLLGLVVPQAEVLPAATADQLSLLRNGIREALVANTPEITEA